MGFGFWDLMVSGNFQLLPRIYLPGTSSSFGFKMVSEARVWFQRLRIQRLGGFRVQRSGDQQFQSICCGGLFKRFDLQRKMLIVYFLRLRIANLVSAL